MRRWIHTAEPKSPRPRTSGVARRVPCFLYNVEVLRLAVALLAASLALWPQDTRVILLGTGTPNPEGARMGPWVAVVSRDRFYIVDCGPGVARRAARAGIRREQLTRLFVTHLHSDHTAGYPD